MNRPIASRFIHAALGLLRVPAIALALGSCAFGYQSVYEGDVRFEHCYRVDDEPQTPLLEKQRCWAEWTQRYTYGQTRDRISYALARQHALGDGAAPGAGPSRATPAVPKPVNASPQPTNAFAPPPQMLVQRVDGGPGDASAALVATATTPDGVPGSACGGVCAKHLGACGGACRGEACFSGCDERYRTCMRSCF